MRILVDEPLPRDPAPQLLGREAVSVQAAGGSSIKNGTLVALAATQFDVFRTADRNIEFQQNMQTLPIAIVVLQARNNRVRALEPLLPDMLQLLNEIALRALRKVGAKRIGAGATNRDRSSAAATYPGFDKRG